MTKEQMSRAYVVDRRLRKERLYLNACDSIFHAMYDKNESFNDAFYRVTKLLSEDERREVNIRWSLLNKDIQNAD